MSQMSDYLEDAIRNYFKGTAFPTAPTDLLLALYTAAPSDSGGGTEVTTGVGYLRKAMLAASDWTSGGAGTGQIQNTNAVAFAAATGSWGTVTHFGVFDDLAIAGGGSTTLAADPALGNTNYKVTAVTNFAVGDLVKIDTGANREYRKITAVGTSGSGGTGIDVDGASLIDHGNGVAFVEVGNLLMWNALGASKAVGTSDVVQFAAGALSLTFA
jgi:hypothetical protein